jgi:hypothetical protein
VDPHCYDADRDPDPDLAQNLEADPDQDRGGGREGVGQPKMCIPPGKILGTPLTWISTARTLSFMLCQVETIIWL